MIKIVYFLSWKKKISFTFFWNCPTTLQGSTPGIEGLKGNHPNNSFISQKYMYIVLSEQLLR